MRMKQRPFFGVLNMGFLPDLWDKFSFQTNKSDILQNKLYTFIKSSSCTQSIWTKVDNQQNLHTSKTNHVIWKILGLEKAPQLVGK